MALTIADLVAQTTIDDDDLFVLRKTTNVDRKITGANLKSAILSLMKGFMQVALTEWNTGTQPQIAANSVVEINGALYTNPSNVLITGATVNSTWYDILLTPSGSSFTASFIARNTGVWSDSKQGLYDGNNRVVACVYRDGSANFINKNILRVINRLVKIMVEWGDWNMDTTATITVAHGLTDRTLIKQIGGWFRDDNDTNRVWLPYLSTGNTETWISSYNNTTITLQRRTGGFTDGPAWDQTSYNRGEFVITYEV